MSSSLLNSLNITQRPKTKSAPSVVKERNQLVRSLSIQLEMAQHFIAGKDFLLYRDKEVKDPTTNEVKKIKVKRTFKPWYYERQGCYYFDVNFKGKPLPIVGRRSSVEVGEKKNLPTVIDTLINAVEQGELDKALLNHRKMLVKERERYSKKENEKDCDNDE